MGERKWSHKFKGLSFRYQTFLFQFKSRPTVGIPYGSLLCTKEIIIYQTSRTKRGDWFNTRRGRFVVKYVYPPFVSTGLAIVIEFLSEYTL